MTKPPKTLPGAKLAGGSTVGSIQMLPLSRVKYNPWNPNHMTDRTMESLKHGLASDGWLASQPLLIWGKDDTEQERWLIIDGEHRHRAASALGFTDGPMVVLDGLSEPAVKALTIKMNQKRGEWDDDKLAELVRELSASSALSADDMGLDLGFDVSMIDSLLAQTTASLEETRAPSGPGGAGLDDTKGDPQVGDMVYSLVVTCTSEEHQAELLAKFKADGLKVKPLIT